MERNALARRTWSAASSPRPTISTRSSPPSPRGRSDSTSVPLLCAREIPVPRLDAARHQGADPLLRAMTSARVPGTSTSGDGRAALRARPERARHNRPVALEFSERIRRIPYYPAAGGYAQEVPLVRLASNESPYPPLPRGARGDRARARHAEPLPRSLQLRRCAGARDRYGVASRASRSATAPATSCSPRARRFWSRAPRSSTPGRPSRSIPTSAPPPARAR